MRRGFGGTYSRGSSLEEFESESDGHTGDEEDEEGLELADTVALEEEESEGVADGDQHSGPEGDSGK